MTERSIDDFDGYADDYRDIHSANIKKSGADSYYFAEHKIKELSKHETQQPLSVLDLGCGDGVTGEFMLKYFPHWEVQGIDVSEQSINVAREKKTTNATYQTYNGRSIPFPDAHFDIIFMAAVMHHIDFSLHHEILKDIYRVLKPGGRLYLFEHNPLNPVTRHFVNTCPFDKDARLLYHGYTRKLIKAAGFRSWKNKFILFFPRKGIFTKMLRFEDSLGWLLLGGQYYFRAVK